MGSSNTNQDIELIGAVRELQSKTVKDTAKIYALTSAVFLRMMKDIVCNDQIAQDLLSGTYMQIEENIKELQVPRQFYEWAGKMVTTKALNYMKLTRAQIFEIEEATNGPEIGFDQMRQDTECFIPKSFLQNEAGKRLLQQKYGNLSIAQKVCAQFFYCENLSAQEIAGIMGISEELVKRRISAVRNIIKEAVSEISVIGHQEYESLSVCPVIWSIYRKESVQVMETTAVSSQIQSMQSQEKPETVQQPIQQAVQQPTQQVASQPLTQPKIKQNTSSKKSKNPFRIILIAVLVIAAAILIGVKIVEYIEISKIEIVKDVNPHLITENKLELTVNIPWTRPDGELVELPPSLTMLDDEGEKYYTSELPDSFYEFFTTYFGEQKVKKWYRTLEKSDFNRFSMGPGGWACGDITSFFPQTFRFYVDNRQDQQISFAISKVYVVVGTTTFKSDELESYSITLEGKFDRECEKYVHSITEPVVVEKTVNEQYSTMLEYYSDMGVDSKEITERLENASDRDLELYALYEEFCGLYNEIKLAYRNVLSDDQYSVAEELLLNDVDKLMAYQAYGIETFMDFADRYAEYPEVDTMFESQIAMLRSSNDMLRASIDFLNDPVSRDIMTMYTAEEVAANITSGYNVPTMIQLVLMEVNDPAYSDLIEKSNNLAVYSEESIGLMTEYYNLISTDEVLVRLSEEYVATADSYTNEYLNEIETYYNSLMGQ